VLEQTGAPAVSLLGWSMGGILIYLHTALQAGDSKIQNIITLGSPVDFARMFPYNILAKLGKIPMRIITDQLGNIPPILSKNGFRIISPMGLVRRYIELLRNYWDKEWVSGFESINDWVEGFIPYPGEAFKQFVTDFIIDDKLKQGGLSIDGREVDLTNIRCPLLVFLGTVDKIAPAESVDSIVKLVDSPDVSVRPVKLGHIGLVAGGQAPGLVWNPCINWLLARSGSLRTAKKKSPGADASVKPGSARAKGPRPKRPLAGRAAAM